MNQSDALKKPNPSTIIFVVGVTVAIIITVAYILIYLFQPLAQPWNDIWLYAIFVLAAVLAATSSTLVTLRFRKNDPPRQVWIYFSLGLWSWAVAELVWMMYSLITGEVAPVSMADVFWLGAYLFFAGSFARQFQLIYSTPMKRQTAWLAGIIAGVLLLAAVLATLVRGMSQSEQTWVETFVMVAYPLGDLAIVLAALRLSHLFGRGLWGRVWWGLIFFTLSDALYSWLEFSGIYALSVETGNPLSLITDVVYFDAYLLVGLACLSQWLLMHFGLSRRKAVEITAGDE